MGKRGDQSLRAIRGSVFLIRFDFGDRPRRKYCVLMEDVVEGMRDVVLVFSTSDTSYHYKFTTVLIPPGTIPGIDEPSLIECHNCWKVSMAQFSRAEYLGQLPDEFQELLDEALTHVRGIDDALWLRMCG